MTKLSKGNEKQTKKYYTLVSIDYADREEAKWTAEFGAYERADVVFEMQEMYRHPAREASEYFKIIETGDTQEEINAAIDAMNTGRNKQ